MNSETKKEFLQKYKLDSYSRAIPASKCPTNAAILAEYCEPVDSQKILRSASVENEDYNSDPEKRYAQPQDALDVKKIKQSNQRADPGEIDNDDVYELAQQPMEDNVTPQKKPSPRPRSAKHMTPQDQNSVSSNSGIEAVKFTIEVAEKDNSKMSPDSDIKTEIQKKKRPGKKVVEIEYEVASAIRLNKPGESASGMGLSGHDQGGSKGSINPDKYIQSAPEALSQFQKVKSSDNTLSSVSLIPVSTMPQSQNPDVVLSGMNKVPEDAYEEPWDLKMKRLKQEQEKKGKKLAKRSDKLSGIQKTAAVYDNTWDSQSQQHKLEERMSYVRSMSQTSEAEIFHDALESFSDQKAENNSAENVKDQASTSKLKPLPQNTYEDAWDLKNSLLELKIREMQLQASAIYEEPWDSNKQQKQLHAKLCGNSSLLGMSTGEEKVKLRRASSEAQDIPPENSESNITVAKGKHQTFGEISAKARGHGCNIGQRINPMIPLASQNWYHGNISREDAEKMLCVCKEGSYIVRISSDRRSYSLSIKSVRQYIHVQIDQRTNEDGSICYILGKNSKEFCTIPEMIDYYTHHRVPLKGAEHITLLHPVECKWS